MVSFFFQIKISKKKNNFKKYFQLIQTLIIKLFLYLFLSLKIKKISKINMIVIIIFLNILIIIFFFFLNKSNIIFFFSRIIKVL